jgi:NADPH-dependent 2,4-dienoyl-CoA reductase/sulfur reductase-like enzyme
MDDGGRVVITSPAAPYRCPPGPYERASLIAHYLKTHKPRSKLLILDEKDNFSKMPLFQQAWRELYGDLLEWRGVSAGGRVLRVDAATGTIETEFETIHADVANIIPPQNAGDIAARAGLVDETGWCPIDAISFQSTLQPNIHLIGDAAIAAPIPKSAFAANVQGKVCALQIARLEAGLEAISTTLANTCFSYVSPDAAISISGVYHTSEDGFAEVEGSGGVTPIGAGPETRAAEAGQAANWFQVLTAEAFG